MRPTVVFVTFQAGGVYQLELRANAEAYVADIDPSLGDTRHSPNAPKYDALRELDVAAFEKELRGFVTTLQSGMTVMFDNERVQPDFAGIEVPDIADPRRSRVTKIRFTGKIPDNIKTFTWSLAAKYGDNFLVIRQDGDAITRWLRAGDKSEPFEISDKFVPKSWVKTVGEYIVLGFEHIVPKGLDHILFVLGIFFLSLRLKPILWQVTAFTVAHTITLGLTIYGFIALPSSIVEPLIAASIVYVGVENVLTKEIKPWRVAIVFAFGLLHGMGFAGVLTDIGLPESEFLTALLAFNVGVELGQLAVIGGAFLALGIFFRTKSWYRTGIVIPASAAISLVGLYWTLERTIWA